MAQITPEAMYAHNAKYIPPVPFLSGVTWGSLGEAPHDCPCVKTWVSGRLALKYVDGKCGHHHNLGRG